jgi:hypothetical protein
VRKLSKLKSLATIAVLVGACGFSGISGAVPVTPGGTNEGSFNNCVPFCFGGSYQQLFEASSFEGLSGIVSSIAFRLDSSAQPFTDVALNIEVRLSHTAATATTLSATLADNRGADETLVLSGIRTYSASRAAVGPNPFDFVLDLDDVFFYNGQDNLLVEITVLDNTLSVSNVLDARYGLYTARAFGTGRDNVGLVAQFDIVPQPVAPEPGPVQVPAPGTLGLLGAGLLGAGTLRRRVKS